MKNFILILFSFLVIPVIAQDKSLELAQKIEGDTLFVKWIPINFKSFDLLLSEKADVHYMLMNKNESLSEGELIEKGTHVLISPREIEDGVLREEDRLYLSAFLENESLDENGEKYAFGTALIKNLTDEKFQDVCQNSIAITNFSKREKLIVLVQIGDIKVFRTIDISEIKSPKEVDFELSLDKKKTIDIEWKSESYQDNYFAYYVEKSIGDEKNFKALKEKYLPLKTDVTKKDAPDFVRDDSLVQGEWHYYRVNGYDLFGRKQNLGVVKKIYVPALTNALLYIDTIEAKEKNRIVRYSVVNSGKQASNISETLLFQSENREFGYSLASTSSDTAQTGAFTITIDQKTGDSYYYKVAAVSPDKDTTFSTPRYFFTLDQEAPESARNLNGECDSLGIVSITWEAPNESDIRGYRVYRANDLDDVYTEKTVDLRTATAFKDTLRLDNLTPAAYYYITVVDSNYNHSGHSDTIKVVKPDTIAPSSALMTSIKKTDSTINISWERSVSNDLEHSSLLVNRKGKVDTLLSWTPDTLVDSFSDHPSQVKGYLTYFIISEDHSGNTAKSNEVSLFYESGIRPPLDSLNGIADRSNKQIVINWPKANYEVFSYDVYRGKSEDNMELVKTIDSQSNLLEFVDRNIYINNTYVYAVKYITEDGVHSIPKYVKVVY